MIDFHQKLLSLAIKGEEIKIIIKKSMEILNKYFEESYLVLFDKEYENIILKASSKKKILINDSFYNISLNSRFKELIKINSIKKINLKNNNYLSKIFNIYENKNFIVIPIISNRKKLGLIFINEKSKLNNLKQILRFKTIGRELGDIIFISNKINSQEKKISDLSSISDISKQMTSLDLHNLLKMVIDKALSRVNAVSASIMLLEGDELNTVFANGIKRDYKKLNFKIGEGAAGFIVKTRKPLFIKSKIKDKRFLKPYDPKNEKNSYFGLPLIYRKKVLGVLNIDFRSASEITNSCKEYLKILASYATVAIRNTELYDSSIRRIKRLGAIYEITKTISATLDLEKVLDLIVIKIIKIMKANVCSVYLLNKNKTHLVPKSVYNMSGQYLKREQININKSLSGEALLNKKPVYSKNIQEDIKFEHITFAKRYNLTSFLSIPLIIENHGIGVINIYSRTIKQFTKDEVNMLSGFSDQAAIAIEKAILYRHIKSDKERLGKLLKISDDISSTLDFDRLLNNVLMSSIELTGADSGAIMLLDNEELYVYDSYGYDNQKIKNLRLNIGKGITGYVARTGESLFIKDVKSDPRFYKGIKKQKSEATLPILIRYKVFGVLNLDSKEYNKFEKHKETLEILMDRIAVAIENSWLYQETENFNKKLKEEVKIATKNLLDANKRLLKLDEIKSDFVSNVSHELRTPLTSIIGYTRLIFNERLGSINENQKKSLKIVIEESERLTRLINDLLDLSKLEKGKYDINLDFNDINEIIDEVLEIMCSASEEKCIRINVKKENIEKIELDKDKIKQVLNNLLSNALKFTDKNGRVNIISRDKKNFVEIEVNDTGKGISKEHIPKLFNKFYQVDPTLTKITSGTGLGLPIAKHIIKLHGGDIKVKSQLGKGSSFKFTISKNLKITSSS